MARSSSAAADDEPIPEVKVPPPPINLTGIIILPPSYRRPSAEPAEPDSPTSSSSDPDADTLAHSTSVPDLRGVAVAVANRRFSRTSEEHEAQLNRRLSTSTSSLNVRFAPLPQLAPRKRKSSAPLGIASRAAMMRKRRAGMPGFDHNGDPLPPTPPMWSDEEVERHTQRVLAERSGHPPTPRDHADDPLLILGKKMKSAWRKMSNNKKPVEGADKGGGAGTGGAVVVAERVVLAPLPADNHSAQAGDGSRATGHEEGGVWEEEISADRFQSVGQTDTIAEGRYPWLAQLAGMSDSPTDGTPPANANGERPPTLYIALDDADADADADASREASATSSTTSLSTSTTTTATSESAPATPTPANQVHAQTQAPS